MAFQVSPSIIPPDETARMAAVRRYDILDTPPDGAFDRVTAIAARTFGVPIPIISVVDHDRIWFKSHHGVPVQQIDREPGLCASAILQADPYILEDAKKDIRSLANPLVAGEFGLRFYAGVPLRTHDGHNLGTLCVIGKEARPVTQGQVDDLRDLASLVIDQLELRLSARNELARANRATEQAHLMAREIEHRVANSLQFVSALLRLQGKQAPRDVAAHFDMAANRVGAVARAHRHLLDDENVIDIPALAYITRLCADRGAQPERVWLDLNYSPVMDESGKPAGVIAIVIETTERVLAERRTAAEQERQRQMLSQMPGFTCMLAGPQHIYEYVNEAYEKIAGRTGFVGRTVREMLPELEGQGYFELLDQVYSSGKRFVTRAMEIRLHGSDETQFIDFVYEPIRNAEGKVTGIFAGGYEVSEAHRALAALRQSETRLLELNADLERRVVERTQARGLTWQVSPDLLGALNSKGYFETSNPAWQTMLGWSEDEVASMSIFEMLHPDDVERTRAGFELTQLGKPAIRFPNRYRCKDGSYRWISWVGVPEGGMVYCSGRDITSEKAAEAERDRLWVFSEDMLARANYQGAMTSINPAWTNTLGYSEHELLTRPYAEIIHPEDLELTTAALQSMAETGQPTRFENRILTADGNWKHLGWTVSPEPDGKHFIAVGRDLSADKARQQELQQAQEALRQAQKMEAIGQLTGGIAHDFNNLLAGIGGSLELLERRLTEGRYTGLDRYISGAKSSTARASALTQRLLAFSRRQTLDPKAIRLNELIAGMEDLIRRTVGPSIELEVVGAGGLWITKVDPSQVESALLNLCINARDAMPNGGRITIETANKWLDTRAANERDLVPGQYVSLCVTDTGTGMTPDIIEKVFDPFFTTKPLGQGTGLGLSMIHGFARQSGGQVRIYSEVGRGTTMCLYFPRFAGSMDEASAPDEVPAADSGQGETVLVIDDETTVRLLMVEVLQETGYSILEAADGPSGLKILQSDVRIDLLVTDVGLPGGINGRQVADAARSIRPDLKVLFVTGYAENAAIGSGLLGQGMQVIAKPFAMADLANKVCDMIDG